MMAKNLLLGVVWACLFVGWTNGAAFAADANKPHPHQGVAPKFTNPSPVSLTAAETAKLESGKAVRKQVRYETGGRGISVMDIHASPERVWEVISDFPSYPNWIDNLETCEIYQKSGEKILVHFELKVFGMGVEYWIHHVYRPEQGSMTWTLDYSKESDIDDSTGYWLVYASPGRDGYTRVEYTVDLRLSGWVPGVVEDMLANKGLEEATTWVKKQSEG
jgi:uncharacterized membrane protein